ncbi:MAG: ATP-binding cassette domain-containing protein [Desulfobacterales bacterium]
MPAVEINNIVKSYADKIAVDDLSFSVDRGEIFGLIGPNGAGKTSTIRMMMDIIKPDSGEINILGEKINSDSKNKIGFLPEERGLYRKLSVMDTIRYLASLKGMDPKAAEESAVKLLDQTGMLAHRGKKIEALSKGMGQIIQFIVTVVHDPELVILDEPFTGLDPVNTELVKDMFHDLRDQGKAVILSTHRMNDIEELCDRILMIDNGRAILYGSLADIKSEYSNNSILLDYDGELSDDVPGVSKKQDRNGTMELFLDGETTPQQLLEQLVHQGIAISRFEAVVPSLRDIFLQVVGGRDAL